jgi:hypothetical protein
MKFKIIFLFFVPFISVIYGQSLGHGDSINRAKNTHAGNQIRLTFFNYGSVGTVSGGSANDYTGEWPIGTGETQLGSAEPFVISEIQVATDTAGNPIYLHPCIFSQGWDPSLFSHSTTGKNYGFEPLPGFLNITQKEKDASHAVAMSHEAYTWPSSWPDRMTDATDPGWPGHWNGFFGKDQKNADQESYFVVDDYQYGKVFGQYKLPLPDSTDPNRGGLGLRMYVRGLQWSNPDAEDVIFWLFTIENMGNLNLPRTMFGFNVGSSNGSKIGCSDNNISNTAGAAYYRDEALAVNFSTTNVGCGGYTPVPWVGYAFLESPGNPFDGIDNDADGNLATTPGGGTGKLISTADFTNVVKVGDPIVLIDYTSSDYKRTVTTAPADSIVIKYRGETIVYKPVSASGTMEYILTETAHNGMDDNLNGLIDENDGYKNEQDGSSVYLYLRSSGNAADYLAKNYITGDGLTNLMIDERRDDGIDNNGNWDSKYDDVGLDGKAGSGDYGEGDGKATSGYEPAGVVSLAASIKPNSLGLYDTGLTGEPDIDKTDVQESDQIGLTSFKFYKYTAITYSNDDQMYQFAQPGLFDSKTTGLGDYDYIFSCGYFPLLTGQTNFFSVALIFGIDETQMLRNKVTVQKIYNASYNFATAPSIPIVTAVAGNHKVTLMWDDKAEQSFDRYLHTYNFEGYKIYRGTYQTFADAGEITDGYGYSRYLKPIAIYDKVDGLSGFFPKDFGTGVLFNLGNESGLVHEYVDSALTNGLKYFYAVTAFTTGDIVKSIGPAETSMFVNTDQDGNITLGQNVITAIPQAPAAGYQTATFDMKPTSEGNMLTSGVLGVNIVNPDTLINGDEYEIRFLDQSMDKHYDGYHAINDKSRLLPTLTTGFTLTNLTQNVTYDTVWFFQYAEVSDTNTTGSSTTVNTSDTTSVMEIRNMYNDSDKDPNTVTALVDGMKFFLYNPPDSTGLYTDENAGIVNGIQRIGNIQDTSSYGITFAPFSINSYQTGTRYPRSYRIVFYDSIITTSQKVPVYNTAHTNKIYLQPTNANFKIYDYYTGEEMPFGFSDVAKNSNLIPKGHFSAGDYILLYEKLSNDSVLITYQIKNNALTDTTFYNLYGKGIGKGDTLNLITDMQFTSNYKYKFRVTGQKINTDLAKSSLNAIKVVPNPFVVTSLFDPQNPYTTGRGTRIVQFTHLPQKCTIKIFTVDGSLVRTLEHSSNVKDGSESWNLLNRDNMEVAYGVYVYHVNAPGIGEHIGKIMLIK